jgi:uncharacterized membrane protein
MNLLFYELLVSRRLQAPAKAKEIRYRVRKVVKNHVIKYISTPIIEPEEEVAHGQPKEEEPQPEKRFNFYS